MLIIIFSINFTILQVTGRDYSLPGPNTTPSTPLSSDDSNDQNYSEPPSFVNVDPVQLGYMEKSVIDLHMNILQLEKQMLYLKGLCEQVAKSLQEDLQDIL